jgi:NADH-ubiquinone oxidoreductase chain 1
LESELVAGFMTEHGASIFVFFFLGEYSSLILMSAFLSVFFLGGHHCPDLHKLILDPILSIYSYYWPVDISSNLIMFSNLSSSFLKDSNSSIVENSDIWNLNSESITLFSYKDSIYDSINLLIDKIYSSYILGFKIILVVFFFIWVRASFPRLRYDQLMSLCWKELLPLVFAYIIFTICIFYTFNMIPFGLSF